MEKKFEFVHARLFFSEEELSHMQLRDFVTHREMFRRLAVWCGGECDGIVLQGVAIGNPQNQSITADSSIPVFRFGAANNAQRFKLIFNGVITEFDAVLRDSVDEQKASDEAKQNIVDAGKIEIKHA